MNRLLFYLHYAARNLWRSRRWSTFAIFSVAAGVATVVALRSLGLAIGDALTSNVRSSNYGDITIGMGSSGLFNFRAPDEEDVFSDSQLRRISTWAENNQARLTAYTVTSNLQITALEYMSAGRPQFITSLLIDTATFPPTQDILAVDPAGIRLGDLFTGGNEVVVSQNLADSQGIQVGDQVRVSGTEEEFVVRGIVPPTAYAVGFRDPFAAFFGFAFFSDESKPKLPVAENPNRISLILPDGTTNQQITEKASELRDGLQSSSWSSLRVTTVPRLLEQNQRISEILGSFIVAMGLGALLIGGVGIVNTMLVMVQRRTDEIASLKTFGLKGRQVAALFMSEALILGFFGSLIGGVIGVILSSVANAYGQVLVQVPLTWRIYPEAILFGAALGLIITAVFGVAPVVTAVKVRPAIILRPNETVIPRLGCLQSLLLILLVVIVVGLIAGQILSPTLNFGPRAPNPFVVGIIAVAITFVILGILVGLLWLLVWLVGKLPTFGSVDLRLALRNLSTRRVRTATTLLAISAGMFALSSISFIGAGTREILQFTLSEAFGGNVLIFPVLPPALANPLIDTKLNQIEGVEYRTRFLNYNGEVRAVDGQRVTMQSPDIESLREQMAEASRTGDFDKVAEISQQMRGFSRNVQIAVTDTTNPNYRSDLELSDGRNLTADDRGQPVTVVRLTPSMQQLGVRVGSTLRIVVSNKPFDLTVVGVLPDFEDGDMNFQTNITFGSVLVPPGVLEGVAPQFQFNIAQVAPQHLNQALLDLSSLPLVFSLDITFIDSVLARFINQFSAIPILVGLLSLGAAAVIMANTVALSTLERRRQIGILKAIGLKSGRVLRVMLLENTVVSLLGGLLGIGLSSLGVVLMTRFGMDITMLIPTDALPVAIALVIAALVIAWAATFLSARPVVAERVTSVLRYE